MPPVTRKAPRASKLARAAGLRRSRLSRKNAPTKATALKGTLTNSTQRQPGPSVRRPPKSTPAAPPMPETAAQTPRAVLRSRVDRKVLVSVDSAAGESIAAPSPWAKRAPTSSEPLWAQAADQRRAGEHDQSADEDAAAAEEEQDRDAAPGRQRRRLARLIGRHNCRRGLCAHELALAAVEVHGQRREDCDQQRGCEQDPGDLAGGSGAGHEAALGGDEMADGVDVDEGAQPARHRGGIDEDVAGERQREDE